MTFDEFVKSLGEDFEFDTAGIEENTTFEDINFDEFDMIELVMNIEDKYQVEITQEDLNSLNTIGEFARFLDQNIQLSAPRKRQRNKMDKKY